MTSAAITASAVPRRDLPRYGALVFIFGFLVTAFAFYPGLTSPDSDTQFSQFRTSRYVDDHPLVSTLIWKLIDLVVPGPAGYFFLLLCSYWFGFFVLSRYFCVRGRSVYLLSLALPFAPFLINFSGTLWKDVLLFDCFLVATAIALYYQDSARKMNALLLGLLLAAILVGALARYNSALAAVPLLILLWTARGNAVPSVPKLVQAYVLSALIVASGVVVGLAALDHALSPTRSNYVRFLFLFDLMGISHQLGKSVVPGALNDERIFTTCYEPQWWDSLWLRCRPLLDDIHNREWDNIPNAWLTEIRAHPKEYLKHRLAHFRTFFSVNIRGHAFPREVTRLALDYGFQGNFLFMSFDSTIESFRTFAGTRYFFSRGFWLVYSVVLCSLCFTLFAIGYRLLLPELLIALSGASYAVPLIFVGISLDLRYVYWTIACCCIATLMLFSSLKVPEFVRSVIARYRPAGPSPVQLYARPPNSRKPSPARNDVDTMTETPASQQLLRGTGDLPRPARLTAALRQARPGESVRQATILGILLLCFVALVFWFPPRTIIDTILLAGAFLGLATTLGTPSLHARAAILVGIVAIGTVAAVGSYRSRPLAVNVPAEGFQITVANTKEAPIVLTGLSVDGKLVEIYPLVTAGVSRPHAKGGLFSTDVKLVIRYEKPYARANLDYFAAGGTADLIIADRSATRLLRTGVELHATDERFPFSPRDLDSYTGILLLTLIVAAGSLILLAPAAFRIQTPALVTGVFLAVVGFWLASYPGLFSPDSANQFYQCSSGIYTDWHPIPHSLTACAFRAIGDTPFSLTVFQSTLYFLVMLAALFGMERKYAPAAGDDPTRRNLVRLVFVIIAFNPSALAILMVFWKDILFGICLLISVALIGRLFEVKSSAVHTILLSLALSCVVLFRANGFLYLIVLIPLAVIFLDAGDRRSVLISSCVAILAYAGYKYAIQFYGIRGGQGTWIMHALAVPLQTIAYAARHDLITDPNQLSFVQRLFDVSELPRTFSSYNFASIVYTSLRMDVLRESYGQILATWLSFAMAHPVMALKVTLKMGWMIFFPFQIEPFRVWFSPSQPDSQYLWNGDAPFQHIAMAPTFWEISTALDKYISNPVQYALLSGATSIWMSTLFLIVFVRKSAAGGIRTMTPQDVAPTVAIGSVILFMLGNALILAGPDQRYVWFLHGLAAFAFGLAFIRQREPRP